MKEKEIIEKWLDHEDLTATELEAFKNLEAYNSYIKISETAKKIKVPTYNVEENLYELNYTLKRRKKTSKPVINLSTLARIAAVFIVMISTYFLFFNKNTITVRTLASEKTTIQLPDQSSVTLNASSKIDYNNKNWENHRKIELKGEAYFKVAKGKKFNVVTAAGIVQVHGTQFNVKQRPSYFEVTCYEGLVSVEYNKKTIRLPAGTFYRVVGNEVLNKNTEILKPKWTENQSVFTSTPYKHILEEFERQYNVTIVIKNINQDKLFTGNFVHSDIKNALKSITIPMRLRYEMNDNTITLYKQ